MNLFQISEDKNVTTSEVKLTAKPEDNGKNITCRAENTQMSSSPLAAKEASLKLDIMCKFETNIVNNLYDDAKVNVSLQAQLTSFCNKLSDNHRLTNHKFNKMLNGKFNHNSIF